MAIGSLAVRVSSDTTQFNAGMKSAGKQAQQLKREAKALGKQAAVMSAALAAAGAAIAVNLTTKGLAAIDAQAKLARSIKGTVDSVTALQLAASDAGIDGMEKSISRLNRRLGAAERGTGAAANAVELLNLDLKELSSLDADERVARIADAVRDSGMSAQATARAVQDLGFEQNAANDFFRQGGDAIRRAREEVDEYGLSVSEIDATMIENANDAFARTGRKLRAVSQRLAVEVAPILDAVSKLFIETGNNSGKMGEQVSDAFEGVVDTSAFAIDAVAGVNRSFQVAGRGVALTGLAMREIVLEFADSIINGPIRATNQLIETLNRLPKVNIDTLDVGELGQNIFDSLQDTKKAAEIGMDDIQSVLMEPMPGGQFKAFIAESREAAESSAMLTVAIRNAQTELKRMAEEDFGLSLRLGEGDQEGGGEDRKETEKRLEALKEQFMSERELLNEKLIADQELIDQALENKTISEQEHYDLSEGVLWDHQQELTQLEEEGAEARKRIAKEEARAKQEALSSALSNMSTLMNSESRKMFEAGKAAAIANSLLNAKEAITGAYKVGAGIGGPLLGAAYGAAAGLAQYQQIQSIRNTSFGSGGGAAGSATQQASAGGQPVQNQQQQQQEVTRNVRVEGVDRNSLFSGEQLVATIEQVWKDGGGSGRVIFD